MDPVALRSSFLFRLTALWGFCESGIGGWMHALQLPFTGFFIGALAIIMISLIAWHSEFPFRDILRSTMLVLLIKATVSPHSPPPAYVAVAFQGLTGAVFYRFFGFRTAGILLGVLTMTESALQKVLIATIIFGNSLWQAIDSFFKAILRELSIPADTDFSLWVILLYTSVYAVWGTILGMWMGDLPGRLERSASRVLKELPDDPASTEAPAGKKTVPGRLLPLLIALLFIVTVLLFAEQNPGKAINAVLRPVAVILLLVFVVNPLFRFMLGRWAGKGAGQPLAVALLARQPALKAGVRRAYKAAKSQKKLLLRFQSFVTILLVLTLYAEDELR